MKDEWKSIILFRRRIMKKIFIVLLIFSALISGCFTKERVPSVFLIPEGFKGWIQIIYNQKDYKPIPKKDGKLLYKIDKSGILKTSTKDMEYGWASDEFYFVNQAGNKRNIERSQMIHGESNGNKDNNGIQYPTVQQFFVGTQDEFNQSPIINYPMDVVAN
jgi:hypothetical protein